MVYYTDVPATKTPAAELSRTGLLGTSRGMQGTAWLQVTAFLPSFCHSSQHVSLGFHKGVMPLPVC